MAFVIRSRFWSTVLLAAPGGVDFNLSWPRNHPEMPFFQSIPQTLLTPQVWCTKRWAGIRFHRSLHGHADHGRQVEVEQGFREAAIDPKPDEWCLG